MLDKTASSMVIKLNTYIRTYICTYMYVMHKVDQKWTRSDMVAELRKRKLSLSNHYRPIYENQL